MKFCCERMEQQALELKKDKKEKNHTVTYDQICRTYLISCVHYDSDAAEDMACEIHYCPWCGSKLPKELSDEWFDTLEKEYGITDPSRAERSKVPSEFKTDEWWIKRGL